MELLLVVLIATHIAATLNPDYLCRLVYVMMMIIIFVQFCSIAY